MEDLSNVNNCEGFAVRTWTATDACGSTNSCQQTITVQLAQPVPPGDFYATAGRPSQHLPDLPLRNWELPEHPAAQTTLQLQGMPLPGSWGYFLSEKLKLQYTLGKGLANCSLRLLRARLCSRSPCNFGYRKLAYGCTTYRGVWALSWLGRPKVPLAYYRFRIQDVAATLATLAAFLQGRPSAPLIAIRLTNAGGPGLRPAGTTLAELVVADGSRGAVLNRGAVSSMGLGETKIRKAE